LDPDSEDAVYTLGVVLLTAGDGNGAAECVRTLERIGTVQASALARRLAGGGAAPTPK
jgi:hypothetical protein